ncbi:MAG: cupin domain-containing protein [Burkholderiaceae bacterium]
MDALLDTVDAHGAELKALGERLKALRQEKNYSQRELARRAGLTHTTISAIEAGRIDPSLGTLKRVLNACDVRMGEFFHQATGLTAVVPREQITTITSGGVHMRYIAPRTRDRLLEITQEIYDVGADTGGDLLSHEGQEGGVVIRGTFELTLGEEQHILHAGDSYYFASTTPHRFRNIGQEQGEIINAASPPTF